MEAFYSIWLTVRRLLYAFKIKIILQSYEWISLKVSSFSCG